MGGGFFCLCPSRPAPSAERIYLYRKGRPHDSTALEFTRMGLTKRDKGPFSYHALDGKKTRAIVACGVDKESASGVNPGGNLRDFDPRLVY